MKKWCNRITVVVLVLSIVFMICGCGKTIKSDDLVGVWIGSWEYNGNHIEMGIQFDSDGTYGKISYSNGSVADVEEGTYEIKGSKVICYVNGDSGVKKIYKYDGEDLVNNDHHLSKAS